MTYKALKGVEVAGVPYVTGDLIRDLPKVSAEWLLGKGAIEPVTEDETPAPKASKKKGA